LTPAVPDGTTKRDDMIELAKRITEASFGSYYTSHYDKFQRITNCNLDLFFNDRLRLDVRIDCR